MNTAVILTGHFRKFFTDTCESFVKYVQEPLNADVFVHTWDVLNNKTANCPNENLEKLDADKVNACIHPKGLVIDNWESLEEEMKAESLYFYKKIMWYEVPYIVMSQHRNLYLTNEMRKEYERQNNIKYDIMITTRPDILYTKPLIDLNTVDLSIYTTPTLESYDTISDLVIYSSAENMDKYCNIRNMRKEVFDKYIDTKYGYWNPHSIIYNYFDYMNIKWQKVDMGIKLIR